MKLIVDTGNKHVMVSREPVEKTKQNGRQKTERGTGRPMWSTQVFVQDNDGGEVITVTTAGEKPDVAVGQIVVLVTWRPCRGRPMGATAWRSARSRFARLRACSRSSPPNRVSSYPGPAGVSPVSQFLTLTEVERLRSLSGWSRSARLRDGGEAGSRPVS